MTDYITIALIVLGFALTAVICYRQGVMDGKEAMMGSFERWLEAFSEGGKEE